VEPSFGYAITSTFQAMRHRNFRLWFIGQLISLVGTWMQTIAQNWLVYEMTGSAANLGLVNFVGAIPMVLLTFYAGTIADRFDKRRVIFWCQLMMMFLALILGLLCWTETVQLWHVLVLAFLLGTAMAVDTPARQSFVVELVGKEDLSNAIALNSSIFHGARVIGPAVAGILIAAYGVTGAFFLNSASFLAVLLALSLMDISLIRRTGGEIDSARDQFAGIRYLRENRMPRAVVLLISLSSLIVMPFYVLIPIIAKEILGGNAGSYGVLMSATAIGSLIGSLFAANPHAVKNKGSILVASSLVFPALLLLLAFMKGYSTTIITLFSVGLSYVVQNASANSLLQEHVPDHLRGRVLALYVSMLLGMMRIGSLLMGWTAEMTSTPTALASFAIAGIAVSLWIRRRYPELQLSA